MPKSKTAVQKTSPAKRPRTIMNEPLKSRARIELQPADSFQLVLSYDGSLWDHEYNSIWKGNDGHFYLSDKGSATPGARVSISEALLWYCRCEAMFPKDAGRDWTGDMVPVIEEAVKILEKAGV